MGSWVYVAKPEFQSTPPARGATTRTSIRKISTGFQSTPPARGATALAFCVIVALQFQSTPPARGATPDHTHTLKYTGQFQSTPPARGATGAAQRHRRDRQNFNPRPPRGGRRILVPDGYCPAHISIHAPREGGDSSQLRLFRPIYISIHAPREGGDCASRRGCCPTNTFQSTPPARGATKFAGNMYILYDISIHAPREGGDGT